MRIHVARNGKQLGQFSVEEINRRIAGSGYRFQALVYEIVRSLPFQSRRGEMSKAAPEKPKEVASR